METQAVRESRLNGSEADPRSTETKVGRRTFPAEYKQRILAEAATCKHGELGLLLRREGLYSSTLDAWRKQSKLGVAGGPANKKRGPKAQQAVSSKAQLARLQRDNERLEKKLKQAELIIDVQKKLCLMLGLTPAEEVL